MNFQLMLFNINGVYPWPGSQKLRVLVPELDSQNSFGACGFPRVGSDEVCMARWQPSGETSSSFRDEKKFVHTT